MRPEERIEPADAGEAAGGRDLDQRQARLGEQLLGQQQPARLGQRDRRDAELLPDRPAELSRAEAQLAGQALQASLVVQGPGLDPGRGQPGGPPHRIHRRVPRGQLGPAPQARPEPRVLRQCGVREEPAAIAARRPRGTDRPAVDLRGRHPHEEEPVEPHVAGGQGTIAGLGVDSHEGTIRAATIQSRRFRTSLPELPRRPKMAYRGVIYRTALHPCTLVLH